MIIDSFSPAWWLMMTVQTVLILVIWALGRGKSEKSRRKIIGGIFLFTCVFYVWYKSYLIWGDPGYETSVWEELPLAMCQAALIFGGLGAINRDKILAGFGFFVGSLCSLMGMLMPVEGFTGIPLLSPRSIGFYGFHGLLFVQSISLYTLKVYNPKGKDVPRIMFLTAGTALVVHLINYILRLTVCPKANYFFTYDPENNPVLQLLRSWIPINYVYLLPLLIPVGIILWVLSKLLSRKES